jgi:hypothetical protein
MAMSYSTTECDFPDPATEIQTQADHVEIGHESRFEWGLNLVGTALILGSMLSCFELPLAAKAFWTAFPLYVLMRYRTKWALLWLGVLMGFWALMGGLSTCTWGAGVLLLCGLLLQTLRLQTKCCYQFDGVRQQMLFSRTIAGLKSIRPVGNFADFYCLTTTGRRRMNWIGKNTWDLFWEYAPVLVLKSGKTVQLTVYEKERRVKNNVQLLNKILNLPLKITPPETVLVVTPDDSAEEPLLSSKELPTAWLTPGLLWLILAVVIWGHDILRHLFR